MVLSTEKSILIMLLSSALLSVNISANRIFFIYHPLKHDFKTYWESVADAELPTVVDLAWI